MNIIPITEPNLPYKGPIRIPEEYENPKPNEYDPCTYPNEEKLILKKEISI